MPNETIEVKSRSRNSGEQHLLDVEYYMPDTLDEAIQRWGEDLVLDRLVGALRAEIRTLARRHHDKGYTAERIRSMVAAWDPIHVTEAARIATRLRHKLSELDPSLRTEVLSVLYHTIPPAGEDGPDTLDTA